MACGLALFVNLFTCRTSASIFIGFLVKPDMIASDVVT